MRTAMYVIAALAITGSISGPASAQNAVPPQWNYQGSAVCPQGYDYFANQGLCISRGDMVTVVVMADHDTEAAIAEKAFHRAGIEQGSAVCPQGYDYYANVGLCLPQ